MNLRIFLSTFLVLLLLTTPLFSQLSEISKKQITTQLLKRINKLRLEKGSAPLKLDHKLQTAAKIHSHYMNKNSILSHSQDNPKYSSVDKRIEHFAPLEFDAYGENILISSTVKLPLDSRSVIKLANQMFNSWKNSPGHYQNMIDIEFTSCNFGFKLTKNKQVYATNVFGRKGVRISNQLSANSFGLVSSAKGECQNALNFYENILVNMGNAVRIEGNSIVFYYHDKARFLEMFSNQKDGLAIDLIEKDQLKCGTKNNLDISPIYDGILLKPVFRDQILRNNTAQSEFRLISKIGTIPPSLLDKDLTINVLIIKSGIVCKKVIPSLVPSASYPLKKLAIKLDNPKLTLPPMTSKISSASLALSFKANKYIPVNFPTIPISNKKVVGVTIKTYSSIEGNEDSNMRLHDKRAKVIKEHLKKQLDVNDNVFRIETKENWDEFQFQVKMLFADSLITKSKVELRELASSRIPTEFPWDSLLYDQRKSIVTIYYESHEAVKAVNSVDHFNDLNYAIMQNDVARAKKALLRIYHNDKAELSQIFEESILDYITNEEELVQNTSAILTKCHQENPTETIKFINKWLTADNELNYWAKFNLLNLYTIVNYKLLAKWDLPSKRLANVVNPKYVRTIVDEEFSNEMLLNLNLTFIRYFGQVNDAENIDRAFTFISDYFESRILKIEDGIALSKFYNHWSQYNLTNRYLAQRFNKNELNEEALFLLLKTIHHYPRESIEIDIVELNSAAIKRNKVRWCNWVTNNVQLLRERKIKGMYCELCNN